MGIQINGQNDTITATDGSITVGTNLTVPGVLTYEKDVISVKDFGAVGDGVTDDTDAIQAALDAAQTNLGGTVLIPIGEYKVTSPLTAGQGIQILGLGTEFSTKIRASSDFVGDQVLLVINGSSLVKGAQIKNLRIQLLDTPDGTDGIVLKSWYNRGILENVTIDGLTPRGRGVVVTNNPAFTTFKISQDWSMRNVQVFKKDGTIGDGTASGNGTGHCFDIFRSNEFTMENCRAEGSNAEPTRNSGFHFMNCYGGVLNNVHAHGVKYGIWVENYYDPGDPTYGTSTNSTWGQGLTILGPTYEAINNRAGDTNSYCLYIKGTTGADARTVTKVYQLNPRYVDGASNALSNTYMEHARWCEIQCGKTNRTPILTLGDGVQDCILHPVKLSKLSITGTSVLSDNIIVLDSPTSDRPAWNFNGYGCILNKDVAQTLTTAVGEAVTWGVVVKDDYGFYDEGTDNTRITVPAGLDGTYLIQAQVGFSADATGIRELMLYVNGSSQQQGRTTINNSGSGSITSVLVNTCWNLSAGDYIQVYAKHNNGTTLALNNVTCRIAFHKISS